MIKKHFRKIPLVLAIAIGVYRTKPDHDRDLSMSGMPI